MMLKLDERKKFVDRVIEKIARQEPHEFERNPRERWRVYLKTLLDILDAAHETASISRFTKVCDALKIGFAVASKDPTDDLLDIRSWVQFGFRVLCKTPKTADWSIIDRDDTAITGEERQEMLKHLFPMLQNMLIWANKFPEPKEPPKFPDQDFRGEIIKHIKMREANYWESAMDRKMFSTDRTSGTSNLNVSFFQCFLYELRDIEPEIEKQPLPELTTDEIERRVLWELEMADVVREQRKFAKAKDGELSSAIRSEREKWQVEDFDFDGITAALKDALSDNPSGKGLTIKMYDDLRKIVSHDWMASVSVVADNCFFEELDKRTIFKPEEHQKYCALIDALKHGFENRARKAETPEIAQNWQSAAEMVSSSLMRESLGQREWEFLFSLISCGRVTQTPIPLRFMTKGTPEYKRLHKTLDGLIAKIAEILPPKPCYMREYLDFLVGFRDGTLEQGEMLRLLMLKNHGLVTTQADADLAFRNLQFNIEFYNQRLRSICDRFEEAGRKGGKDLLGRYELIQADNIANGLNVFNPNVFGKLLFHDAYALCLFQDYGYADKLPPILQQVDKEWARFFDTVIVAAAGKASFVAARNAYAPLRDQLQLQFGVIGLRYAAREERLKFFETFKKRLDDLAMTVFECDSLKAQTAAPQSATAAPKEEAVAPQENVQEQKNNDETIVQRPGCPHITLNLTTRTVTIKTRRNTIKTFVVPDEYDKAWTITKWIFQETDAEGYYEFKGPSEYYRDKWVQQFCHSKKPNPEMCELALYIHSVKGVGKRGATRIRLEDHQRKKKSQKTTSAKRKIKHIPSGNV